MKAKQLKTLFNQLLSVVERNPVIPVIGNILFADNALFSTDLKNWIKIDFPHNVTGMVEARIMKRIISGLGDFDDIEFYQSAEIEKIDILVNGIPQYFLTCEVEQDYPKFPDESIVVELGKMSRLVLPELLKVCKFCSIDVFRPAMTAISLEKRHAIATDGHMLIKWGFPGEFKLPLKNILINTKAIAILERFKFSGMISAKMTLGKDGNPHFEPGNYVFYKSEGFTMASKTLEERYPDYENVIPDYQHQSHIEIIFYAKELEQIIKRALTVANSITHQVILDWHDHENSQVNVSSEDLDFGTNFSSNVYATYLEHKRKTLPKEFSRIGFNGKLMLKALSQFDGRHVSLKFQSPNAAMMIEETILLMPVMINDYVL